MLCMMLLLVLKLLMMLYSANNSKIKNTVEAIVFGDILLVFGDILLASVNCNL